MGGVDPNDDEATYCIDNDMALSPIWASANGPPSSATPRWRPRCSIALPITATSWRVPWHYPQFHWVLWVGKKLSRW